MLHGWVGAKNTAHEDEKPDLASIAKNVIFVLAIYSYFAGWVYAHQLYDHFGVPLTSIEIPIYFFFMYSYRVIGNWWIALACLAIMILVSLMGMYWPRRAAFLMVVLFPVIFYVSKIRADTGAKEMRTGYAKAITFVFKNDIDRTLPRELVDANRQESLKLITLTSDRFYVLRQPHSVEIEMPVGFTYIIFKEDVLLARIGLPNTEWR